MKELLINRSHVLYGQPNAALLSIMQPAIPEREAWQPMHFIR